MRIKQYLQNIIDSKTKRAKELREQIKAAQTADEVRALGDTLQAVLDELKEAEQQLADADKDDDAPAADQPADQRSANPMHEFRTVATHNQQRSAANQGTDPHDTVEYRTAFMDYVCRGVAIPAELRADAVTTTADAGAVIPTTILHEIVKELKTYGNVYAKVRKLNVQGGVQIPILSLKPTATWVTANTGASESDKQKLEAKEYVVFNYYGLECKLAQTLLTSVVTLEMFQAEFPKMAAEAMAQALDVVVFNGTGAGQPLGIIKDTRVPAANIITLNEDEFASWESWKKKVFAKMAKAYRNGEFFMAQATFDGHIDGMVDSNGQPIGRVNYGITDGEVYRFGGKAVETVEEDVLPAYESAASGDVVAVFCKLSDYAVNTNMQMQVVKWVDHDTNEVKNKTILIADGKLVDPHGVLLIKKA